MDAKIEQAIERSTSHNEVVTLPYSEEFAAELEAHCDDYTEDDAGGFEYWAAPVEADLAETGATLWRVHLHPKPRVARTPKHTRDAPVYAAELGSYRAGGARGKVEAHSDEVRISLENLTVAQAKAVLAVLTFGES